MQLHHDGTPLAWLEFPLLAREEGLLHSSYTRLFGNSLPPYSSLNVSYQTEDHPEHVKENIATIIRHFERRAALEGNFPSGAAERRAGCATTPCRYVEMNQVHGKECALLLSEKDIEVQLTCDAIITDLPNVLLTVKHADCQPIVLYHPQKRVIAAIHAGWRGICQKITSHTVDLLVKELGVEPSELIAGIGPSIGPLEFETWEKELPPALHTYVSDGRVDLWQASIDELCSCGLPRDKIECAFLSTYTLDTLFFSYRRNQKTGRNATSIMLVGKSRGT